MLALFFALLIVSSSFFAISEISLAAAKRVRLQSLADEGNENAKLVLALQEHPGRFFTVVQLGLNAIALAGGIVGDMLFTPLFDDAFGTLGFADMTTPAFWVGFVLSTVLFILFADLIPKRIALIAPESISMKIIRPFNFLITLLKPFIWLLNGIANLVIKAFGLPLKSTDKITSEDIIATVDAGTEAGILDTREQYAIENIFNMENRTVASAMTLRENIVYLSLEADEAEINRKISGSSHSHYVVCDKKLDNIVGVVDSKALLSRLLDNQKINLRDDGLVYPALVLPDAISLSETLESFRKQNESFAIVINEYALVVGVVTVRDVMSTVMGDLVTANEEDQQIVKREDGSWLVDGGTAIDDVENLIGCDELPEDAIYETLGGFLMYMLRRVPKRGDQVLYEGFRFEVVDVDHNRIDQVIISKVTPKA